MQNMSDYIQSNFFFFFETSWLTRSNYEFRMRIIYSQEVKRKTISCEFSHPVTSSSISLLQQYIKQTRIMYQRQPLYQTNIFVILKISLQQLGLVYRMCTNFNQSKNISSYKKHQPNIKLGIVYLHKLQESSKKISKDSLEELEERRREKKKKRALQMLSAYSVNMASNLHVQIVCVTKYLP